MARRYLGVLTPERGDERPLIAVDGSSAFLGLKRPDGLLQFAARGGELAGVIRPFAGN